MDYYRFYFNSTMVQYRSFIHLTQLNTCASCKKTQHSQLFFLAIPRFLYSHANVSTSGFSLLFISSCSVRVVKARDKEKKRYQQFRSMWHFLICSTIYKKGLFRFQVVIFHSIKNYTIGVNIKHYEMDNGTMISVAIFKQKKRGTQGE